MIKIISGILFALASIILIFSIGNFIDVAQIGFPTIDRLYPIIEVTYLALISLILIFVSAMLLFYDLLANKK